MGKGVFRRPWFPAPRNRRRFDNIYALPPARPGGTTRNSRPWRFWGNGANATLARRKWFPHQRRRLLVFIVQLPAGTAPDHRPWVRRWWLGPNAPLTQRRWFPHGVRRRSVLLPPLPVPVTPLPKRLSRPWVRRWWLAPGGPANQRQWFPRGVRRRSPGISPPPSPQVELPKRLSRPWRPVWGVAPNAQLNERKWYPHQRKRYVIAPAPPPPRQLPVKLHRGWTHPKRRVKWMPKPRYHFFTKSVPAAPKVGPLQQVSQ